MFHAATEKCGNLPQKPVNALGLSGGMDALVPSFLSALVERSGTCILTAANAQTISMREELDALTSPYAKEDKSSAASTDVYAPATTYGMESAASTLLAWGDKSGQAAAVSAMLDFTLTGLCASNVSMVRIGTMLS